MGVPWGLFPQVPLVLLPGDRVGVASQAGKAVAMVAAGSGRAASSPVSRLSSEDSLAGYKPRAVAGMLSLFLLVFKRSLVQVRPVRAREPPTVRPWGACRLLVCR
jgi:hypothetical protein